MRRIVFWLHLGAGVVAGVVIVILSATGTLLAFERQITGWADGIRVAPPAAGASHVPIAELLAIGRAARPESSPSNLTLQADPEAPAALGMGREGTLFIDPYTGNVLGEGSKRARAFFRAVTDWHRHLSASGESRAAGRAVTGACNLAFLFVLLGGLVLWWPARWTASGLRAIVFFRGSLRGKARDFNWHNVVGIWSLVPLAFVVSTAVPISYPWASDLVYRLAGEEPPARPATGGGRPGSREAGPRAPSSRQPPAGVGDTAALDALWARAQQQVPEWRSLTLRLPVTDGRATFAIDTSTTGAVRPDKRSQLTLDAETRAVVRWEPYESQSRGRRIRTWMRFTHTGEAFGVPGQAVAGAASAGVVVLAWTGWALALRRLRAWLARRAAAAAAPQAVLVPGSEA